MSNETIADIAARKIAQRYPDVVAHSESAVAQDHQPETVPHNQNSEQQNGGHEQTHVPVMHQRFPAGARLVHVPKELLQAAQPLAMPPMVPRIPGVQFQQNSMPNGQRHGIQARPNVQQSPLVLKDKESESTSERLRNHIKGHKRMYALGVLVTTAASVFIGLNERNTLTATYANVSASLSNVDNKDALVVDPLDCETPIATLDVELTSSATTWLVTQNDGNLVELPPFIKTSAADENEALYKYPNATFATSIEVTACETPESNGAIDQSGNMVTVSRDEIALVPTFAEDTEYHIDSGYQLGEPLADSPLTAESIAMVNQAINLEVNNEDANSRRLITALQHEALGAIDESECGREIRSMTKDATAKQIRTQASDQAVIVKDITWANEFVGLQKSFMVGKNRELDLGTNDFTVKEVEVTCNIREQS